MLTSRYPPSRKPGSDPRLLCRSGGVAICCRRRCSGSLVAAVVVAAIGVAVPAAATAGVTAGSVRCPGDGRSNSGSPTIVFRFSFLIRKTIVPAAVKNTRRATGAAAVSSAATVACAAAAAAHAVAVAAFPTAEPRHGVGRGAEGRGNLFLGTVGLVAQPLPQVQLHLPEYDGGEGLHLDDEVAFLVVLRSARGAFDDAKTGVHFRFTFYVVV